MLRRVHLSFLCRLHQAAGLSVQLPSASCVSKSTPFSPTPHTAELPFKPRVPGLLCSITLRKMETVRNMGLPQGTDFSCASPLLMSAALSGSPRDPPHGRKKRKMVCLVL